MSTALFNIRQPEARDLSAIAQIFASDNMPVPSANDLIDTADANSVEQPSHALVAVNNADEPVGLIRILEVVDKSNTAGNGAYVYPVIVYPDWQHCGIATALIDAALKQFGELKLVACKASQGFYPKVGFAPLDWSEVATLITKDCEMCAEQATCNPQPFTKR